MAGHSHWANIAHKKGRIDAKRGALFGKLSRAIMVAARNGGADPDTNLRLRYAIDKARKNSMPKDNIEKAVKKGAGDLDGEQLVEIVYEGYGPGGVAVIVEALTENRNRTASEVRNLFDANGGNLGASGSVSWMFDRKGIVQVPVDAVGEDQLFEAAVEAGADDVKVSGEVGEVSCPPEVFDEVVAAVSELAEPESSELAMVPQNTVTVEKSDARRLLRMLDGFDENQDVQNVTANFEIPDELMAELAAE